MIVVPSVETSLSLASVGIFRFFFNFWSSFSVNFCGTSFQSVTSIGISIFIFVSVVTSSTGVVGLGFQIEFFFQLS